MWNLEYRINKPQKQTKRYREHFDSCQIGGRDYVYWADLWRETARYRPGVAEKPKRSGDPMAAEGRAMPMALMSPFLHPRVAESGRQWTAVGVGPWPFPG